MSMLKIKGLFLLLSVFMNLFLPMGLKADLQDCFGGEWRLVLEKRDLWAVPPDFTYVTSGYTMGFWEQPTSCEAVAYADGYKIVSRRSLVCVPPSLTKIEEAPEGESCAIEGSAIPQPRFTDPCVYFDGMYTSWYGNITTAKSMKKYKLVCPNTNISPGNNEGPPDTCQ